jgi:hypothetical protein
LRRILVRLQGRPKDKSAVADRFICFRGPCLGTKQKRHFTRISRGAFSVFKKLLNYCYICGGRPFLALLYIKCNPVTFIKGFKSGRIDTGVMNEYIRAIFLFDKPKSLLIAEPFHCSISHRDNLLSKKCRGSKLQVIAPLANGFPPQERNRYRYIIKNEYFGI